MKEKEEHVELRRSLVENRKAQICLPSPSHTGSLSYYSGEERKGGGLSKKEMRKSLASASAFLAHRQRSAVGAETVREVNSVPRWGNYLYTTTSLHILPPILSLLLHGLQHGGEVRGGRRCLPGRVG